MDPALGQALEDLPDQANVVILSGAGISAESGIPTFRGSEGYWTVGAKNYHPTQMATAAVFQQMPLEVWRWYLYRRGVCRAAEPNAGHRAIVSLEDHAGSRFRLITQNVDGLHLRAGNSLERTFQIHGNIDFMRCSMGCSPALTPVPAVFDTFTKTDPLSEDDAAPLRCPSCGERARPHVLWFDEYYEETLFRSQSALEAATRCDLLIVVGTSGSTNLPMQVGAIVARGGGVMIDVNPDENPFSELARSCARGFAVLGPAGEVLPELVGRLLT